MKFRLRDLLVLVLVAALVMPLIVQQLDKYRERSRREACQDKLRLIGVGMFTYANRSKNSAYCSGAVDFYRDGCIDTWGWAADAINQNGLQPEELLDASNRLGQTEAIADVLSKTMKHADPNGFPARSAAGICGSENTQAPGVGFGGTLPTSKSRTDLVHRELIAKGYNTNYAASWLLVRTQVRTQANPKDQLAVLAQQGVTDFRSLGSCLGPLSTNIVDRSRISSTIMPVLGCANAVQNSSGKSKVFARSFGNGPSFWDSKTAQIKPIAAGADLLVQITAERNEGTAQSVPTPTGSASNGNNAYLQDTSEWFAVHAGTVNLLMADGSIAVFQDLNGDGLLNPGFDPGTTTGEPGTIYRDKTVELLPNQFFGGVFVNDSYFRGCLEY